MHLLSPKLQAFVTVAENGTVHGAAASLHITQTGVTQRIKTLEGELGVTLFLRSRRGMALTQEGSALLGYCKSAMELEGRVFARLGNGAEAPHSITVHGSSDMLAARVLPAVERLAGEVPGAVVRLVTCDAGSGLAALRHGRADIAVVGGDAVPPEFEHRPLRPLRVGLFGPPAWRDRPVADLVRTERAVETAAGPATTRAWLREAGIDGGSGPAPHVADSAHLQAALAAAGLGYAALAVEFSAPWVRAGHLVAVGGDRVLEFRSSLAWYPRPHYPPGFEALVAAIG